MQTEILVAIVAAVGSLILGVINSIISYLKIIKPIKAEKEIEYRIAKEKERDKLIFERFDKSCQAVKIAIVQIQEVKDILQLIVDNKDGCLLFDNVLNELIKIRGNIFTTYEKLLPDLEKEDSKFYHNVKNSIYHLEQYIKELKNFSNLEPAVLSTIQEFRINLSEEQNKLRDSLLNKISLRISDNNC
ncbi:MAG: hypothetical protein V1773_15245 [bacterium]